MKLISLNTWGGRAGKDKLLAFFDAHKDVDVFCLQEIWSAPYEHLEGHSAGGLNITHDNIMVYGMQEISALLSTHTTYFKPHHLENYGLMTLIKKDIDVIAEGDVFVYKEKGHVPEGDVGFHARNVQYITFATPDGERTVLNFHGLWNGGGKGDSEDRLLQSDRIIQFMKTLKTPYVMVGDFNLLPDTESIKKLENFGLRNLIKENGITSTRTSFYTKEQKFADYTLVSDGVKINDFKILPDEVSDHSPMYVDFE
jgi:endonuclease/exonuclease/phosphatase (EEP) superfamily protein YafD